MTPSAADPVGAAATAVIAVGGHESARGAALASLLAPSIAVAAPGRDLRRCAGRLLAAGAERVCVVPMTVGRDERLVPDIAATLAGLPSGERERVLLASAFGTTGHLVGWLRTAALGTGADAAIVLTGTAGTPGDDAELYRVARLVRQYGRHALVEPALIGGDPDVAETVRRCRALGADQIVVLPAGFVVPDPPPAPAGTRVGVAGPVLSAPAVAGVLRARVADADRRFAADGDTGLAAGLAAGHDHDHVHDHDHAHDHGHQHSHGHPGGPGHLHDPRHDQTGGDHGHHRGHSPHDDGSGRGPVGSRGTTRLAARLATPTVP